MNLFLISITSFPASASAAKQTYAIHASTATGSSIGSGGGSSSSRDISSVVHTNTTSAIASTVLLMASPPHSVTVSDREVKFVMIPQETKVAGLKSQRIT